MATKAKTIEWNLLFCLVTFPPYVYWLLEQGSYFKAYLNKINEYKNERRNVINNLQICF